MSNTQSDAAIEALAKQHLRAFAQFTGAGEVWFEGEVEFARAVLAKWGTPQPVARDPLTDEQVESLLWKYGYDPDDEHMAAMLKEAHGIKGGQHGAE